MATIDRILTTHVGSLPRPQEVVDLLFAQDRGDELDPVLFDRIMQTGVDDVVRRQADAGIDVISDGETSKISYATYIRHRLTGFDGDSARPTPRDLDDFPHFRDRLVAEGHSPTYRRPVCTGPVGNRDCALVVKDIARFTHAMAQVKAARGFMTAVSPGTIGVFHPNQYYRSHEAYMQAVAAAMRSEYEAIVGAGFLLQIDCPDLGMGRHSRFKQLDDAQFLRCAEIHVEALNDALVNVPADRTRMHVCWGNYEGPHTHDIALTTILPVLLKAKPAALVIEGANPRHEHEWEVWTRHRLPDDKVLVPGVIDTSTNYVEHPDLVAQRITRFAHVVGRERVLAGTDCGMGTFAGFGPVHPEIAWAKLRSLVSGARLASQQLWKPAAATV
ncbi:MAG TPA: cobalamin-independent methionine synthase II family protein [Vicinamibacterales bacterium]|nr:cobalamin-independent methionine synthase II family protein [Vicinamibacterales bacterium]